MSEMSASIAQLATALAVAQGRITGALKDSANPFFRSKYADLASVWDACRGPLSENGLSVIQTTSAADTGITVVTTLAHKSGEWIRGVLTLMPKEATPQGIGSAITYARRYALAAIVGVAQVDDDANAASGRDPRSVVVDPRGEMGAVDPKIVNAYVSRVADVLAQDAEDSVKAQEIYKIHSELATQHDLYITVADKLAADKIIGKNVFRKYIEQGKPQPQTLPNGRAA